ncbi:MAG: CoB--CoM heterodisulfide reductase iron-sulfur subunit A family protein [Canidatus Methanoxibalbensis ujae]|nr:CoB--CoM heterodisulfide reductase iron-sulfur subunit A family protein [Candidatus Methanoxibalbensis ujae]
MKEEEEGVKASKASEEEARGESEESEEEPTEADEPRIGVYVCHCGINIALSVDVEAVRDYAKTLPNVVLARNYIYMCSDPGQALIAEDLKAGRINRVIVAACSPRMHELTFRKVCADNNLNPYFFEQANIREHCSWPHVDYREEATEKAKEIVKAAVARVSLNEALEEKSVSVEPAALVIGGGVAGIQSALDIADAGFKVYLVEKKPSIGGHAAQLSKTFPIMKSVSTFLAPRMIEVGAHPNVVLLTNTELVDIGGFIGNYEVKAKKKPRYVDERKCTGCGECEKVCPVEVPNEYDEKLSNRKAIYLPFHFAVPPVYVVDEENCALLKGKCEASLEDVLEGKAKTPCMSACPEDAIDFSQKEQEISFKVGTIIVATGYDIIDPRLLPEYHYGEYPNIITGLEFERLSSASGPTGGKIVINGKEPKDIVFISCVGSRNKQTGYPYCSRVCCMYLCKQAHFVKEQIPDANVTVLYQDVRAFGKGFEEFWDEVMKEGVVYRRGIPGEIYQKPGSERVVVRFEDTMLAETFEIEADLVVLGVGLRPSDAAEDVIGMLKLSKSADGFLLEAHPKLRPVDTAIDGIFVAGCCQGPKDITDTVAQGRAAASAALAYLVKGVAEIEPATSEVSEDMCVGCRCCERVCPFGAIEYDEHRKITRVNEAICKGCGCCVGMCPSGAASVRHFRDKHIYSQIEIYTS